jgi:hypothetical protein
MINRFKDSVTLGHTKARERGPCRSPYSGSDPVAASKENNRRNHDESCDLRVRGLTQIVRQNVVSARAVFHVLVIRHWYVRLMQRCPR